MEAKPKQIPRFLLISVIFAAVAIGSMLILSSHLQGDSNTNNISINNTPPSESTVQSCSFTVDSTPISTFTCGDLVVKTLHPISAPTCTFTYNPNGPSSHECTNPQQPVWLSKPYSIDPINVISRNGINYIQFTIPSGIPIEHEMGSGDVNITDISTAFQTSVESFSEDAYFGSEYDTTITEDAQVRATQTSLISDLRNYTLQLINDDRTQNGLSPVKLSDNQAAQIQAEDILKSHVLSHWTSSGEKPYMVYTDEGGMGAVAQNIAYDGFIDSNQCNDPSIICNKTDPTTYIKNLEWQMVYNDSHSNWGHKENILDPHHTNVSVGIAYDDYYLVLVQNFENNYIHFISPITENSGIVSFSGNVGQIPIEDINVFYDPLPSPTLYQEHKNDESYDMGTMVAIIQPPPDNNSFYPPSNQTALMADKWTGVGNDVDISFDMSPLVTKPGVYTLVAVLNNNNDLFQATTFAITKTSPLVQEGYKSPKVLYACSASKFAQYQDLDQQGKDLKQRIDSLKQQYAILNQQYSSMPQTNVSDQEYQQEVEVYNQLTFLTNQINNLIDQYDNLRVQAENFRC